MHVTKKLQLLNLDVIIILQSDVSVLVGEVNKAMSLVNFISENIA